MQHKEHDREDSVHPESQFAEAVAPPQDLSDVTKGQSIRLGLRLLPF